MISPERVLVVDDDESTRNVLRKFLEHQRHTVTAVSTAAAALSAMDKEHYFAASVATAMGRTEDDVELVRLAGRLHDIGLIRTREELLLRAGPLTQEELSQVRGHVVLGWQLLAPLSHLGPVAEFVRGHHEQWDGSGYPESLAGNAIPWGAQVLAAAEVYDAMTTARPYKEKISLEEAVERMEAMSGVSISPEVSAALADVVAARRALVFVDDAPAPVL